jgi:hypothetical protein
MEAATSALFGMTLCGRFPDKAEDPYGVFMTREV